MLDDLYLYGGDKHWDPSAWVTTDDRVRGGSSISHLDVSPDRRSARFHGHLDTSTLGGAGFASQRSEGVQHWDLSPYDGILLTIETSESDGKKYLVTLKDEIPGRRKDGREESGISWEADFTSKPAAEGRDSDDGVQRVFLGWEDFKATYRGRDKPDAPPLDKADVKRIGLMMRSFFGQQDGDFSLVIRSIQATKRPSDSSAAPGVSHPDSDEEDEDLHKTAEASAQEGRSGQSPPRGWRRVFCGLL